MHNNLKKSFFWNMIGITLNSIYSIIIIICITRHNSDGIVYAGQFSYAFYISSLFYTIGNYGGRILQISDAKNKYTQNEYISLKYISNIIMLISTIIFILINGYNLEKCFLILLMIIYRVFESFSDSYYGVMQKNDNLELIGKSMALKAILSIISFIALYYISNSIIIASLSFIIIFLLGLLFIDRRYCIQKYHIQNIKITSKTYEVLKSSFYIFLFSFLTLLTMNISRYFVDLRLDDAAQGYFSIIILPASIITLMAQFLVQPFLITFVDLHEKKELKSYRKKANQLILSLFGIGLIIAILMYYIGTPILELIYKVDLEKYYIYISILIISGICNGAVSMISNFLTILKRMKIQLILFTISIVIAIIYSISNVYTLNAALNSYTLLMTTEFILFFLYYLYLLNKEVQKHE